MATIERRGNRQWRAKVRKKGSPAQSRTFNTRADAERWGREVEVAIDRGIFVSSAQADNTTLSEAARRYEREVSSKKKSAKSEKWRINLWCNSVLADKSLSRIRGSDIALWRDDRLKEVKSGTVRNDLALLSHIYTKARKEWGMEGLHNPLSDVSKPPPGQSRIERINPDEQAKLVDAAKGQFGALADIIEFAIETAMRRSEIFNLLYKGIDFRDNVAYLGITKSGKPRNVALSLAAISVINRQPKNEGGRVFESWRNIDDVTNDFRTVADQVGLDRLTFHDCRHEATSRLFEKDLGTMEVASITGHETLSMLNRYTHLKAKKLAVRLD